jgi:hypothetical protein
MNREESIIRIVSSELFGPALKARWVEQLHNIDDETLGWLMLLLDQAEVAHKKFGETSKEYMRILADIETTAMQAAEREADKIFAEFERQLLGNKT